MAEIVQVPITEIDVGSRYRKDYGDMEKLEASILKYGLICPIILDADNKLVDGGRRLRACMTLGHSHIDVVRKSALDDLTRKEYELETCVRRKDLEWPEEVLAVENLFKLKQQKYGKAGQGARRDLGMEIGGGVSQEAVAEELDMSAGSISMDLALARALREFPDLAFEKTKSGAMKRYKREREKKIRVQLAERERQPGISDPLTSGEEDQPTRTEGPQEPPKEGEAASPPTQGRLAGHRKAFFKGRGALYYGDSTVVLRSLPAAIADCMVTDPPYGINLFREGQTTGGKRLADMEGGMYDDDPKRLLDVLDKVFREAARILKPQAHAYVFFHHNWYEDIYQLLGRHFGEDSVIQTPNIWIKNTPGIGDPNERWVPAYEPFFFINRGRPLIKPQAFNYIKYDTVTKGQKIHPTEKPTLLLRHIIEASCVEKELVLDPFAGSCSTLVAAVELGCRFYGVEADEAFYTKGLDRLAETIGTLEESDAKRETSKESADAHDSGADGRDPSGED